MKIVPSCCDEACWTRAMLIAQTDVTVQINASFESCMMATGYECQEADGDFMLVFEGPVQAVNFCVQVSPHTHTVSSIWLLLLCFSASLCGLQSSAQSLTYKAFAVDEARSYCLCTYGPAESYSKRSTLTTTTCHTILVLVALAADPCSSWSASITGIVCAPTTCTTTTTTTTHPNKG